MMFNNICGIRWREMKKIRDDSNNPQQTDELRKKKTKVYIYFLFFIYTLSGYNEKH